MGTITLHCPHCGSDAIVRDGHAPNGKQLYRCRVLLHPTSKETHHPEKMLAA